MSFAVLQFAPPEKRIGVDVDRAKPASGLNVWVHGLILALLLLAAIPCSAATYTANSCSQSDVQAAINLTSDGDTVIIPACSATNWSSGITISGKGIDITGSGTPNTGAGTFGAGTPTTSLVMTGTAPLFKFTNLTTANSIAKVELLNISTTVVTPTIMPGPVAFVGICTTTPPYCPSVRADNLTFASGEWQASLDGGLVAIDNVFGVVDHCSGSESATGSPTFLVQLNYDAWQGVGTYGDNSFASPDTFGTAQEFYMENNDVAGIRLSEDDVSPGNNIGGGRWVCRFNIVTNMEGDGMCAAHGTAWTGRGRGMRQVESYYNTVSGSSCDGLGNVLSGTGYFLSNTFTGAGCNFMVELDIARFVMSASPWNNCDGTQPWDQYPWSSTTACLDQPGSGAGALYTNQNPPTLNSAPSTTCVVSTWICWPNPVLDPVYEAGEVSPNNAPGIMVPSDGTSTRVLANRDYYAQVSDVAQTSQTSPFNGTTGTGYGTLANRPTTCTTGVGYWATDQGTWNTYNSQKGILYYCSSTNTWSVKYTPYTYPHPLDSGSGAISLSPTSENFGSLNVGTPSSPVTFTLTNGSSTTATAITPSVTGGNTGDFAITNSGAGSCAAAGGSLSASASCTFTVTFTPGAAGARATTLSVSYSGGDGASPQTAPLSGAGISTSTPAPNPRMLLAGQNGAKGLVNAR